MEEKKFLKKVKIYSLAYCDSGGGAAIAFLRINKSLSNLNFHKTISVIEKRTKKSKIQVYGNTISQLLRRVRFYLTKIIFLFDIKYTKSINLFNSGVTSLINKSSYDIINFHWIGCESISLSEIRKINKPIVWTLHDMWPISGIYHYNLDKKYFNQETNNLTKKIYFNFLDKITKKRKEFLFKSKKINLISPSKWLLDEAKKTKLPFGKTEIIPYPIDTLYFKKNKNIIYLKDKYKIPYNKKIILFSSNILDETRKGSIIIRELLKKNFLKKNNYKFVMIGNNNNFIDKNKYKEINLMGNISNYNSIKEIYSIADALLFPSIIDNFPNTILEAMACELPCVAFNCYGMKEIIQHKKNGYLADPYSVDDFKKGIKYVVMNSNKLGVASNRFIKKNFAEKKINLKYRRFFKKILDN